MRLFHLRHMQLVGACAHAHSPTGARERTCVRRVHPPVPQNRLHTCSRLPSDQLRQNILCTCDHASHVHSTFRSPRLVRAGSAPAYEHVRAEPTLHVQPCRARAEHFPIAAPPPRFSAPAYEHVRAESTQHVQPYLAGASDNSQRLPRHSPDSSQIASKQCQRASK